MRFTPVMMTSDTLSQGTPRAQVARREFAGRGYAPLPSREERRSGAGLPLAAVQNTKPAPVCPLRRWRTPNRRRFAPCGGGEHQTAAGLPLAAAENTKPPPVCPLRRRRTPIRRGVGAQHLQTALSARVGARRADRSGSFSVVRASNLFGATTSRRATSRVAGARRTEGLTFGAELRARWSAARPGGRPPREGRRRRPGSRPPRRRAHRRPGRGPPLWRCARGG